MLGREFHHLCKQVYAPVPVLSMLKPANFILVYCYYLAAVRFVFYILKFQSALCMRSWSLCYTRSTCTPPPDVWTCSNSCSLFLYLCVCFWIFSLFLSCSGLWYSPNFVCESVCSAFFALFWIFWFPSLALYMSLCMSLCVPCMSMCMTLAGMYYTCQCHSLQLSFVFVS